MLNRILVPIDHSESVSPAVVEAASISSKWENCSITLLHVEKPVYTTAVAFGGVAMVEDIDEALEQEGQRILEKASDYLREHHIEPTTALKRGDPAEEICRYAEEEHVDLIVVGKRDKSLLEKLLGSVSQKVVQNAPSNVLVVK